MKKNSEERVYMKALDRQRNLHERLVDELRSAIVSGELAAGELYSVVDLARTLEVSRTPVREALLTLASQGMVKFERNRGVRILETTIHDLGEVFQIRMLLEVPATRKVTREMNPELLDKLRKSLQGMRDAIDAGDLDRMWENDRNFHRLILSGTGNQRMADYIDSLRDGVLTRGSTTAGRSREPKDIVAEHSTVLERIEEGDERAAADAMRKHIQHTAQLLFAQEAKTPSVIHDVDLDWLSLHNTLPARQQDLATRSAAFPACARIGEIQRHCENWPPRGALSGLAQVGPAKIAFLNACSPDKT